MGGNNSRTYPTKNIWWKPVLARKTFRHKALGCAGA